MITYRNRNTGDVAYFDSSVSRFEVPPWETVDASYAPSDAAAQLARRADEAAVLAAAATARAGTGGGTVVVSGSGQPFNVKVGYGGVGDGVVDDVAAIQAALNACAAAGGGTVYLPPGTFKIGSTGLVIPSGVTLQGAGAGVSTLLQAYWPNPAGGSFSVNGASMIQATGTVGTARTCSAAAPGDAVVTGISSTTGLAAGQYLILASTEYYWSGYTTRYKGEMVRIKSVDSSTQITLGGVVRDGYTTAPTISPLTMVTNVGLADLTIRNTEPGTTHATGMVRFSVCKGVRIRNVELIGSDFAGIRLTNCYDSIVNSCSMYDFSDVAADGQLGYGVLAELATEMLVVSNSRFVRTRHAVTTGGVTPSVGGAPHNVLVTGNVAEETSETAFDTHQCGSAISFVGNQATNCRNAGYTSRSTGARFLSNSASYCKTGFVVWGESGGVGHGTEIRGNVIDHCWGDFGIRVYDADRVVIADNTIEATSSAGIYVSDNATRLNILGNRISNTGVDGGSARGGIEVATGLTGTGWRIERNVFANGTATVGETGTGPGLMTYAFRNLSVGVTGGYLAYNTAVGMVTGMFSDAGGNLDYRNYQLDKPIPAGSGGNDLSTRFESIPRYAAGANLTLASGTLQLSYFTAPTAMAVTSVMMAAGSTPSATLTLGKMGLYSVDASGNLTLLQGSASDTALLGTANALNTPTITSTVLAAGQRYAIGVLVVGTTAGSIRGGSNVAGITGLSPVMSRVLTGQTDLPSSILVGSLASTGNVPWAAAA